MNILEKLKKSPVWFSFREFCHENRGQLCGKGLAPHKLEHFLSGLNSNKSPFAAEFLQDIQDAGFFTIDTKMRLKLTDAGQRVFLGVKN